MASIVASLEGHEERAWHVSWNPAGDRIASCGEDRTVRIWAKAEKGWELEHTLSHEHKRTVRRCEWSPQGDRLATISFDGLTIIWELVEGAWEAMNTLDGHVNEVKGLCWNPMGEMLATCGRDKNIWIWELEDDEFECVSVLSGHKEDIKSVRWHPQDNCIVSSSFDNSLRIWKEGDDDWVCKESFEKTHKATVWDATFSTNGKFFAAVSDDKSMSVFDYEKEKEIVRLENAHERTVYSIDWAGDVILTASGDETVGIFSFDGAEIKKEASVTGHIGEVNCVRFNPADPKMFATCGDDHKIIVYSLK
eukprot:TRINITY_DN776079_c0_g1_i1.p1 TRINITY_DN776079_c0_g1~~TRINITY_DN776079_c0_g1_i1.p1  ORF type:complete len:316 (+),score=101.80 TRINITY_DN776079_c0_g1_i1:30-950(+)